MDQVLVILVQQILRGQEVDVCFDATEDVFAVC